jgi:hypothetical protein
MLNVYIGVKRVLESSAAALLRVFVVLQLHLQLFELVLLLAELLLLLLEIVT